MTTALDEETSSIVIGSGKDQVSINVQQSKTVSYLRSKE